MTATDLSAEDPRDRVLAVRARLSSRPPGAREELVARLEVEEHETVVCALLVALGTLGTVEDIPLIAALLEDTDRKVREKALHALITMDRPAVYPHLVARIADETDRELQTRAHDHVARLGPETVGALLDRLGRSPDENRRRTAITSTLTLAFPGRKAFLQERSDAECPRTRAWAQAALEALGGPELELTESEARYLSPGSAGRDDRGGSPTRGGPVSRAGVPEPSPDPETPPDDPPPSPGEPDGETPDSDDGSASAGKDAAASDPPGSPPRTRAPNLSSQRILDALDDGWEETIAPGPPPRPARLSGGMGMGSSRACPSCAEMIPDGARSCRYCRARFLPDGTVDRGPSIDDPTAGSIPADLLVIALLNLIPAGYALLTFGPAVSHAKDGAVARLIVGFAAVHTVAILSTLGRRALGRQLWLLTTALAFLLGGILVRAPALILVVQFLVLISKSTRFYCTE